MGVESKIPAPYSNRPILVFCHLRWNFVYQRPQHLLARFNRTNPVHFWEEPIFEDVQIPDLMISIADEGVRVITPRLPKGLDPASSERLERRLLNEYIDREKLGGFITWYYTPMAMRFSDHLKPAVVVYDCMDELSSFQGASPQLILQELRLFAIADVVFCGGASLFAAKRRQHCNVHLFPSSIDREHFASARQALPDPDDQAGIPHPRIGFYGVLDERLDTELLSQLADEHPEWNLVLIGPVVKISDSDLPRHSNIHYLGQKRYAELPAYLSNWSVAMLPFARNASTRFISPTKTPEYLAGGKPVVSTSIQDVVRPYGELRLVRIGTTPEEFAQAIDELLAGSEEGWLSRVDEMLSLNSWDLTFKGMRRQIARCFPTYQRVNTSKLKHYERNKASV
jgi:glycosyltransferase involved in cell wall biosynthesis